MYRRKSQGWVKHIDFILLDLIVLEISYYAAFVIRLRSWNLYTFSAYRNMAVVLVLLEFITAVFFETLKNVMKRDKYREFVMTVKHVGISMLLAIIYLYLSQDAINFSRIILTMLTVIDFALLYPARVIWKRHVRKSMKEASKKSMLIVTVDSMLEDTRLDVRRFDLEGYHVAGVAVLNQDMEGKELEDFSIVASRSSVVEYVCRNWVDEVFVNYPDDMIYPQNLVNEFIEMGVTVHIKLAKAQNMKGKKQILEKYNEYMVLTSSINFASPFQAFIKRGVDIAGGIVGCVIMGILVVILGPMIYIQSPGPIFFAQERVGMNGRRFKIYKFRSMYMDAEERKEELMEKNRIKDGMMFKLDYDPRIIGSRQNDDGTIKRGIGNIMRDLSLDEFPQFINILKGEMSLVGTRPPTVDEWEKYAVRHRARLATKPGLTGMWQISGRSNITDFEEVVRLDTEYINQWSLGLDFKILMKTIGVVLKRDGAM